jgi:hypothetical protein
LAAACVALLLFPAPAVVCARVAPYLGGGGGGW